jgi:glycosyltransferase involved in cell wall biosynthesis
MSTPFAQRRLLAEPADEPRPLKMFGWAYDKFGCGNYRIGMPMWAMSCLGHDARAFSDLDMNLPSDLDLLVGQRISNGYWAQFWLETANHPDRDFAMIYEIDDDLWHLDPTNPEAKLFNQPEIRETLQRCVSVADAVTVSTERLGQVVADYNPNVFVLPNCIDQSVLAMTRPRPEAVTVGWAGSPTHYRDFVSVQSELTTFFRKNAWVQTHFVGMNYGEVIGRPHSRNTPWEANLHDYLARVDFDIGIAPLQYTDFNRSKSDIKFLEYAALGIPVVASNFGPYADSIEHGVTGLLAKHPHEWTRYLRQLVNDAAMRDEIGRNAREWAATRTIQANAWRWNAVYQTVAA